MQYVVLERVGFGYRYVRSFTSKPEADAFALSYGDCHVQVTEGGRLVDAYDVG